MFQFYHIPVSSHFLLFPFFSLILGYVCLTHESDSRLQICKFSLFGVFSTQLSVASKKKIATSKVAEKMNKQKNVIQKKNSS